MTEPQQIVNDLQLALDQSKIEGTGGLSMDKNDFFWTIEQLSQSVNGELFGPLSEQPVRFDSVSTDTRTMQPGALYIAIKGEHFDGHRFIEEAIKQGAVAVLVSEMMETIVPAVLVEDTRIALGQFAHWHRQQMPVKTLVGITGSNGKTTTKTLLQNLFSAVGNTLATEGNLNNDFGVPRTLLNIRPEHEFAIIEMGANHPGEIEYLTLLAEPDIVLLNNASDAHIEGFGSLQGVIDTKGEIFLGLNRLHQNGVAVINTDSPGFDDWQNTLTKLSVKNVLKFGESDQADVCLKNVLSSEESIQFDLSVNGNWQTVTMPVLGKHNAMNAAACVAVCLAANLNWQQVEPGLLSFSGVAGRLQRHKLANGWLIDDSYNANPGSVRAGIDALTSLPGQVALCLGAMAELGEHTQALHEEIAAYAKQAGVNLLFVYGAATQTMPAVFGDGAKFYASHQQMIEDVKEAINHQQVNHLLIKGSRSAKMEQVVQGVLSAT
ncbi:MAG: UDP-N-acetylmuramoyl-tripeptide--D-alanyl-D-alanine ligase [Pseudomonadota bacterium]|nr:UDP-N-acetylmuramoyl-tripeptide--D-alanyl-D-alanine ligase [Pseudomonadota bacterium]